MEKQIGEDAFGESVSGELVGAPNEDAVWNGTEKLTGAGEIGEAEFGRSVAESADGQTALVGGVGAAWVFERTTNGSWVHQGEKLTPESGEGFGRSVALSGDGDTALVSGYTSSWVFTRSGEEWTQQAELPMAGSVALSGDGNTALVSGDTSSWVFTRSGEEWTQQAELPAAGSVALSSDGQIALVREHVFVLGGEGWTQQADLTVEGREVLDRELFASSVALSADGDTALIGTSECSCGPEGMGGGAWVFGRFGSTWLRESDNLVDDVGDLYEFEWRLERFGESVWLSEDGSTAVVGAPAWGFEEGPSTYGAVFRLSGFLVPPSPPRALTKPATSVTAGSATLNGVVEPNGVEVTECRFEYGLSSAYGLSVPCAEEPGDGPSPVRVSASVEGLREDTTYHFRLAATNPVGTTYGHDATFTTQAATTSPPEYGRCAKVKAGTGKYGSAGCTTTGGKAAYEWFPGAERTRFTMQTKPHADIELQSVHGISLTCTAQTGAGEFTSRKSVGEVVLTFTGCERLRAKCTSAAAAEGEIVTPPLEGRLGITEQGVTSAKDKVGLDLFSAGQLGPMMEFACGSVPVSVRGSVIVPVLAGKMSRSATLSYAQKKGRQKLEGFVGEASDVLELSYDGAPFEACGLTLKTTEEYEERLEVNPVA